MKCDTAETANLVELVEAGEWNQACRWGHLITNYAVYCHNPNADVRKCRRTWYTGGEVRDEDCPNFASRNE